MRIGFPVAMVGGLFVVMTLGAFSMAQFHARGQDAIVAGSNQDYRQFPGGGKPDLKVRPDTPAAPGPANALLAPAASSTDIQHGDHGTILTPGPYQVFLPGVLKQPLLPTETPTKSEPPAVGP